MDFAEEQNFIITHLSHFQMIGIHETQSGTKCFMSGIAAPTHSELALLLTSSKMAARAFVTGRLRSELIFALDIDLDFSFSIFWCRQQKLGPFPSGSCSTHALWYLHQ
jgi:hypothetical protein